MKSFRSFLSASILGTLAVLLPVQASAQTPAPTTAPVITSQPTSQTVTAGAKVTFNVTASATGDTTYRWFKEARLVSSGSVSAYVIESVRVEDAGVYRVEIANAAGSTVSNLVTLTVNAAPVPVGVAPVITTQPASLVVNVGANATFTVVATGTPAPTYRWFKNDVALEGATSASLALSSVKISDAGSYTVKVSNHAGAVTSAAAALTVNAVAGVITAGPQSQTVKAGANVTFGVTATGTGLTYQWRFKGRAIKGATTATLTLENVGTTSDGVYSITVSNATGVAGAASATLAVTVDARLTNISTRGHVGEDDEVLVTGFVVRGGATKKVVLRAVGPTLGTQFNLSDALANPKLTLSSSARGGAVIDTNSGWGGATTLSTLFTQVGAFPLVATSADAALVATLGSGAYTAQITAPRGTDGVALAELYDADTGSPATEIINISTRAHVGAEAKDTLIAGFAITGTTSNTVIVRGVGASLGTLFGLRRALGATHVAVYNSAGVQVAANTVWGGRDKDDEDDMDDACDRAGTWRLPRGSNDSALLLTLAPGVYTAHVTGVNRASGIALVEIYEVH
jgi:hypothetical protein